MLVSPRFLKVRPRILLLGGVVFCVALWSLLWPTKNAPRLLNPEEIELRFPLAWKHIQQVTKTGGAWYIPPSWQGDHPEPANILEAVQFASDSAKLAAHRQVPYSNIPLIVHQKWNNNDLTRLNEDLLTYVERWLEYSVSANDTFREMAYFWWADNGVAMLVNEKEGYFLDDYQKMFSRVEKVDIFRVLVCKWFGGIYGDVDTVPLKHPADWIGKHDISVWTDDQTGNTYGAELPKEQPTYPQPDPVDIRPVNLLWGLEADTDPETNQYWRMGYDFPVQLTNWAMASAPQHPVLYRFMDRLQDKLEAEKQSLLQTPDGKQPKEHDPLTRTGPAAVTETTMKWLQKQVGLRWNALTGLHDGGRAKLVSDVLILPMTGFRYVQPSPSSLFILRGDRSMSIYSLWTATDDCSPGRGRYGNMGSRPYTDPDARLAHHAMGSWHRFDPVVEYGKFCRTVFGMCKEWSKVPS
ncbi:hypothetical protein QQS21_000737 [Conoideocrella luteorostrata]|uniref:Glycosyltransferase family 32 protein n=1 Tax=Conoideocrella luteorostrata TaxID=1105319 RepID=A0AAJ0CYA9_9HYPO|nr:hypothetical protein QQS21_000737 [Conoideocrella luteorostrata]